MTPLPVPSVGLDGPDHTLFGLDPVYIDPGDHDLAAARLTSAYWLGVARGRRSAHYLWTSAVLLAWVGAFVADEVFGWLLEAGW